MSSVIIQYWGTRGAGPGVFGKIVHAYRTVNSKRNVLVSGLWFDVRMADEPIPKWSFKAKIFSRSKIASVLFVSVRFWGELATFFCQLVFCRPDYTLCVMISPFTPLLCLISRLFRSPYMIIAHDFSPHPGENGLYSRLLLRLSYRCCSGLICLSDSVREEFHRSDAFRGKPIALARHGSLVREIDKAYIVRNVGSVPKILFIGRLREYKGLDIFVGAVEILEGRSLEFHASIAGSGELSTDMLAKIGALKNFNVVQRWLSDVEFKNFVDQCDLVVVPYREASQSGVVRIAQPLGIPVVVTPVGGLVEQVEHEVTGLIADNVSAEAVANAVEKLLTTKELYKKISRQLVDLSRTDDSWFELVHRSDLLHRDLKYNG